MPTFSKKKSIEYAWSAFADRPGLYVGATVLVYALSSALQFGGELLEDLPLRIGGTLQSPVFFDVLGIVLQVAGQVVQWWLYLGLITIALAAYDKRAAAFRDLFIKNSRVVWNYILATVLYALIVLGGTILLIVPGIIWGIKYHFYVYLIVDKRMEPMAAIKKSGDITNGHKWNIFLFFIVIGLLNMLGVLALGIGMLVTVPMTVLASVWVYRWLMHQYEMRDESTDAPVSA